MFLSLVTQQQVQTQFGANVTVLQQLGARPLHFPFPGTARKLYKSLLLPPHWPALCHMVAPAHKEAWEMQSSGQLSAPPMERQGLAGQLTISTIPPCS